MIPLFFELLFEGDSLKQAGIESRDMMENLLNKALRAANLGFVREGFDDEEGSNIYIDIDEVDKAEEALALIRQVLRENGAPNTRIRKVVQTETKYTL